MLNDIEREEVRTYLTDSQVTETTDHFLLRGNHDIILARESP